MCECVWAKTTPIRGKKATTPLTRAAGGWRLCTYASCGWKGRLASEGAGFMKKELTVKDALDIDAKLTTQPYVPPVVAAGLVVGGDDPGARISSPSPNSFAAAEVGRLAHCKRSVETHPPLPSAATFLPRPLLLFVQAAAVSTAAAHLLYHPVVREREFGVWLVEGIYFSFFLSLQRKQVSRFTSVRSSLAGKIPGRG